MPLDDATTLPDPRGEGAPAPAPSAPRYPHGEELGRGGMGVVYLARDRVLEREVAKKTLRADDAVRRARFLREARILARLEHPAIVAVYDFGSDAAGAPFLTMRRVRGETFRTLLDAGCEGHEALEILTRVCEAVAFAHSRGIIHRDLKPANVMVGRFGQVQVMDWGLAKRVGDSDETSGSGGAADPGLTADGTLLGTPAYMAPEQLDGLHASLGPACDVYALGAVLYRVLFGRPPYPGRDAIAIRASQRGAPSLPRRGKDGAPVPAELAAIARRALALAPAARYPDAAALLADLRAFQAGLPVGAVRDSVAYRLRLFARRHRRALRTVAVAALVSLLLVSLALLQVSRARAEEAATARRARAGFAQAWSTVRGLLDDVLVAAESHADARRAGRAVLAAAAPRLRALAERLGEDAEERRLRAELLLELAAIDLDHASFGRARDALAEARGLLAALPADAVVLRGRRALLAGELAFRQRDTDGAEEAFRACLAALADEPGAPAGWLRFEAASRLAWTVREHAPARALAALRTARAALEGLPAGFRPAQTVDAERLLLHAQLAAVHTRLEQPKDAEAELAAAEMLHALRLGAAELAPEVRPLLARFAVERAGRRLDAGQLGRAAEDAGWSLELLEELPGEHDSEALSRIRCRALLLRATAARRVGQLAAAGADVGRALAVARSLPPALPDRATLLAQVHQAAAEQAEWAGELEPAWEETRSRVALLEVQGASGDDGDALLASYATLARLSVALGRRDQALRYGLEALDQGEGAGLEPALAQELWQAGLAVAEAAEEDPELRAYAEERAAAALERMLAAGASLPRIDQVHASYWLALAGLRERQGRIAEGLAAVERARAILAARADTPAAELLYLEHSIAWRAGELHLEAEDFAAARAAYAEALTPIATLCELESGRNGWDLEHALCLARLAFCAELCGDPAAARAGLADAAELFAALLVERPEDRALLAPYALVCERRAFLAEAEGALAIAGEAFEAALDARERSLSEPPTREELRHWAWAAGNAARLALGRYQLGDAAGLLERGLVAGRRWAQQSPTGDAWSFVAELHALVGDCERLREDPAAAGRAFAHARNILEQLVAQVPAPDFLLALAGIELRASAACEGEEAVARRRAAERWLDALEQPWPEEAHALLEAIRAAGE